MKRKLILTFATTILLFSISNAQSDTKKWSLGVNFSSIIFSGEGITKVKDKRNSQFPSIQISRDIGSQFSIDLLYTVELIKFVNTVNEFKYTSVDGYLRYNLPTIFSKIVPFAGVGLGYIEGAKTTPNPKNVISLNVMAGGNFWITENFGLSSRVIYKNVPSNSESMASHIQAIVGVVYRFNLLSKGKNSRLWDVKH